LHITRHHRSPSSTLSQQCWLGGWDKCRIFFVVMVEREHAAAKHR
jgi:hypothetical protein